MKSHFLEASVPLTKTFSLKDGKIEKVGHPNVIECTSHEETWETLEEFAELLRKHASHGHCLLKGNLTRPLKNESRAGTTNPNAPTKMICFDLDGLKSVDTVDEFLAMLGVKDVDHVVQFSSSMGVLPDKGMSAHIYMLADEEKAPPLLKQWLIATNLEKPDLRSNLGLSRTHNTLRYALDVTTCQNDKLIYIAPPVLGPGVKDKFKGDRIKFVRRKKRAFTVPSNIPSVEVNRVATEKALNDLRDKAGLPKRKKTVMKTIGTVEYMKDPDQATVTGIKTLRGFVYFNLNDGDSWAYYHPENNPEIIYNFKGEPPYLTKELLPDYWAEVRGRTNEPRFDGAGTIYLAFRDFRTAMYWNGTFNRETKELNMAPARTAEQLKHFLKQHGQPVGDFVPDWTVAFDPHTTDVVNVDEKFVNKFRPTQFMQMEHVDVAEVPPIIRSWMLHAMGGDEEALEHYLNWLAVIFRYRDKAHTAWVLHGVPGTGKGLLMNEVLRPLLGRHFASRRTRDLDSQFNGYLEETLLLWIDEAEVALHQGASLMEGDLKNYIVEPIISIRNMYMMSYEARSYVSVMLVSNKGEVIHIDPKDRRYNVAPFQPNALPKPTDEDLQQVREVEIEQFAHYLMTRKADRDLARTPLNNAAKEQMINVGMQAVDGVALAVLDGNLQFLWEQRQMGDAPSISTMRDAISGAYMRLMKEIAEGKKPQLLREEIHTIMEYNVGGMPQTPHKFAALLKHHRIMLEPINVGGTTARGMKVKWKISDKLKREILGKD